jgi:hypothetical protein
LATLQQFLGLYSTINISVDMQMMERMKGEKENSENKKLYSSQKSFTEIWGKTSIILTMALDVSTELGFLTTFTAW